MVPTTGYHIRLATKSHTQTQVQEPKWMSFLYSSFPAPCLTQSNDLSEDASYVTLVTHIYIQPTLPSTVIPHPGNISTTRTLHAFDVMLKFLDLISLQSMFTC